MRREGPHYINGAGAEFRFGPRPVCPNGLWRFPPPERASYQTRVILILETAPEEKRNQKRLLVRRTTNQETLHSNGSIASHELTLVCMHQVFFRPNMECAPSAVHQ